MILNDLKPPLEIEDFSEFLAILGCDTHFKGELRAIARNSYGRPNSVCLSVTASTVSRPGEIETSDFHHMIV